MAISTQLAGIVYASPKGLRIKSRDRVKPASEVLTLLTKSERRKVRKTAFKIGLYEIARS